MCLDNIPVTSKNVNEILNENDLENNDGHFTDDYELADQRPDSLTPNSMKDNLYILHINLVQIKKK